MNKVITWFSEAVSGGAKWLGASLPSTGAKSLFSKVFGFMGETAIVVLISELADKYIFSGPDSGASSSVLTREILTPAVLEILTTKRDNNDGLIVALFNASLASDTSSDHGLLRSRVYASLSEYLSIVGRRDSTFFSPDDIGDAFKNIANKIKNLDIPVTDINGEKADPVAVIEAMIKDLKFDTMPEQLYVSYDFMAYFLNLGVPTINEDKQL